MRRIVAGLLLSALLVTCLCGCGSITIAGAVGPGVVVVSGFVSGVQTTTVPGTNGTFIQVTIVTLQQTLGFTSNTFCGNVGIQFPMNSFARVNFQPGTPCATIVVVVISG